jgi:hypothetical protein
LTVKLTTIANFLEDFEKAITIACGSYGPMFDSKDLFQSACVFGNSVDHQFHCRLEKIRAILG